MPPRPNILWIIADELRTDALSCYGHPTARMPTPHIDSIADAGTTFLNTFCNSPICVPSRTSFLTGVHPEQTTVYGNEGGWTSFPFDLPLKTFPEVFAANGYRTVNFGKTHLPSQLKPWQVDQNQGGTLIDFFDGCDPSTMDLITTPTHAAALGGIYPDDVSFPGEKVTSNAVDWLEREAAADAPFFCRLSYLQPHTPVTPPAAYRNCYESQPFPDLFGMGGTTSTFETALSAAIRGDVMNEEERRRVQVEYYGLVAWLDDQVGRVLASLRRLGLEESTIIVFNADHGASLGERGLFSKLCYAPQVHRVPSIFSWKGMLPAGVRREDNSELMDLARTLGGLADVEMDDQFGGRNLFADDTPQHIFSTVGFGQAGGLAFPNSRFGPWPDGSGWPRRTCVRTPGYRLDMNVRKDGQPVRPEDEDIFLVDTRMDPAEMENQAADPALAGVVAELRAAVLAHAATAVEPASIPVFSDAERGVH